MYGEYRNYKDWKYEIKISSLPFVVHLLAFARQSQTKFLPIAVAHPHQIVMQTGDSVVFWAIEKVNLAEWSSETWGFETHVAHVEL